MSVNRWTTEYATSNIKDRGLLRLFYSLRINIFLGINTDFIVGVNTTTTYTISRIYPSSGSALDFTSLMQEFLEFASCQRFYPSEELLSCLMQGLLSKLDPGVHWPKILGHLTQDNNSTISFIPPVKLDNNPLLVDVSQRNRNLIMTSYDIFLLMLDYNNKSL